MVTEPALSDQIAGARAYEALHVPALFRQWCPRVLDAAGVGPGQRVLGQGAVVLHSWWGLNPSFKALLRRQSKFVPYQGSTTQ